MIALLRDLVASIAFAAAGVALRVVLDPWLGNQHAYTTVIAATALSGWLVSIRCGIGTAVFGFVPANYFFVLPRNELEFPRDAPAAINFTIFVLVCAAILVCEARGIRLIERARRARNELEEANQKKDEFLSLLAHELRNPLNGVVIAGNVFKLYARDKDGLRAAVKIHERQCRQLTALIDDLLDVARITRGRIELKRDRHDVRLCVQDAVDQNVVHVESKSHMLTLALPDAPLMAIIDDVRILQIISNLINNAAKYSLPQTQITVSAEQVGSNIVVTVTDKGRGIAPEILARIFDAFYSKRDESGGEHGLGLGLWLSSRLARLHGGSLQAFSAGLGQGARFELCIPIGENAERRRRVRASNRLDC